MPTYARREGGAYARGEPAGALRRDPGTGLEILSHGDLHAHRAVQRTAADGARESRLLLLQLELDDAGDVARARVVHQLEGVHRAVGLAHGEDALGERVEVARLARLLDDVGFHCAQMLVRGPRVRLSSKR